MTAQDVEKLRENRRRAAMVTSGIPKLPHAPQTKFSYGTQAPIAPHRPISGF